MMTVIRVSLGRGSRVRYGGAGSYLLLFFSSYHRKSSSLFVQSHHPRYRGDSIERRDYEKGVFLCSRKSPGGCSRASKRSRGSVHLWGAACTNSQCMLT